MKREIRFRAWVADEKKMIHFGIFPILEKKYAYGIQLGDMPIMQFTGLYDRNKKPIYEGDIVRVGPKDLTQCAYDKFGIPCLLGIKYPEAYNFMELEQRGLNKHFKIIGNVFENPELLKE